MDTNTVLNWGKYVGQPVSALLNDHGYTEWFLAQSWAKDKHPELFELANGKSTKDSSFTPAHNALQLKLLDPYYRKSVVCAFLREGIKVSGDVTARFEAYGIDSILHFGIEDNGREETRSLAVEIKPAISDDYPAVLRQVQSKRQQLFQQRRQSRGYVFEPDFWVVLTQSFNSDVATVQQAKQFFSLSGVSLLLEEDLLIF